MTDVTPLPLPVPTPDNLGFWEACRRHELVAQRCVACRALRHPPRPACRECGATELKWHRLSGRGAVYTYTITHQAVHPALKDRVPWTVVLVDLEEGVRMVSHLVECPYDQVRIGMPVEVVFEDVSEEVSLPYFRPVSARID